jgi:VIT1/CCC1 family predicted Fe2+/Mn2+ transporter
MSSKQPPVPSRPDPAARPEPTPEQVRRWRRHLAEERAEAAVYRDLATSKSGEEREILLALAEAEGRHEQHWLDLLGDQVGEPRRASMSTRSLGWLARRFGTVFTLALAQRAEARSTYRLDDDATAQMAADEAIHEEVVRGLAQRGRTRISGTFRAAVFGANDGLVSNLALILGIGASGVPASTILLSGLAGLLAGALSMGAGEYVSVRSQRELLEASRPSREAGQALPDLDVDANELALVYRARGMDADEADARAAAVLASLGRPPAVARTLAPDDEAALLSTPAERADAAEATRFGHDDRDTVGSALGAALASFCFFATGALVPVLPYLFGAQGAAAVAWSAGLVGIALLLTGGLVGLLSGGPPAARAARQLAIGYGAAAVTYGLGLLFGTTLG